MIARQTRSRVSLAEIPLDALERTLHSLDAPIDPAPDFHIDPSQDPEYFNFIFGLQTSNVCVENDEEASDPDYRPRNVQHPPSKCGISKYR